jgi:hypothetical protein
MTVVLFGFFETQLHKKLNLRPLSAVQSEAWLG